MSVVCVLGATGSQGGSVCAALKRNPNWEVRAITRNPNSASAKRLVNEGVQVVSADADDEASLVKAFEGASAVFALTNYNCGPQRQPRSCRRRGEKTADNIAKAAAKTPTLKHYVMSSLPPADVVSGGKLKVPHFDYKHAAYQWIETNLPDLAAKTTMVWPGWYPTNMAHNPMMKLIPVPGSDAYMWAQPSRRDAVLPIAGDVQHNVEVVVEGILEAGPKSYGKIAVIITDYLKMSDAIEVWESVTGKRGVYVELSDDTVTKLWGVAGLEIASQLRWSEAYPRWEELFPDRVITFEELGVKDKVRNYREALESLKDFLV
ncbi:hypothetical protein C8A00DRAFT_38654 [Chaetomidium leptoderma]|uniref:NmrA-like domain-containing protein n=1 Tax=Chaetomidium leptoderma TaxID=669021 RepID=A0AAN6ZST8_9PEZI|nr:hypothetical protein C8A00DRAFT_38654 [Chaetomidium leptoderma]